MGTFFKKTEDAYGYDEGMEEVSNRISELIRPHIDDEADIEVSIWQPTQSSSIVPTEVELRVPDPYMPEKYREVAGARVVKGSLSPEKVASHLVGAISREAPWLLRGDALLEWAERTAARKRFDHYSKKYGENGEAH